MPGFGYLVLFLVPSRGRPACARCGLKLARGGGPGLSAGSGVGSKREAEWLAAERQAAAARRQRKHCALTARVPC